MNKSVIGFLGRYLKKHTLLILFVFLFSAISSISSLYIPVIAGSFIDSLTEGAVSFVSLYNILLLAAVSGITLWAVKIISDKIAYSVVYEIRNDSMQKIQRVPISFIDKNPEGKILSVVISDAEEFTNGILLGSNQLFVGLISIITTIVFMLSLSVKMTLVVIILTPLSLVVAKIIAGRSYKLFKLQSKARSSLNAFANEMIRSEKTVRAYSYENKAKERFEELNFDLTQSAHKAVFVSSITNPVTRFINSSVYASVALFGAMLCIRGILTVGGLTSFLAYATQYTKPFNEISSVISEIQNAFACAERINSLLETKEEDDSGEVICDNIRGSIEINSLAFSYTSEKNIFSDVDIKCKAGQKIAVIGPTGCGKTTLINLIMRFYDPDEGEIIIDGKDISRISRSSIRQKIGMVLQETWLKNASVLDNIRYAKPNATKEEVETVAKAVSAHSFIEKLERGYDTIVGEGGAELSSGEKQLICIARVMLSDPDIIILDEATSSIDLMTEIKVQRAFDLLMKGRTGIIIAHRLSTIKEADEIYVLSDGKIVEHGNHDTLIALDGLYKELYFSQFRNQEFENVC